MKPYGKKGSIWVFPKIVVFPPKSSILIGFSIINHPFWGTPIFGNTHIIVFMDGVSSISTGVFFHGFHDSSTNFQGLCFVSTGRVWREIQKNAQQDTLKSSEAQDSADTVDGRNPAPPNIGNPVNNAIFTISTG